MLHICCQILLKYTNERCTSNVPLFRFYLRLFIGSLQQNEFQNSRVNTVIVNVFVDKNHYRLRLLEPMNIMGCCVRNNNIKFSTSFT